jgi:hypothetical protein
VIANFGVAGSSVKVLIGATPYDWWYRTSVHRGGFPDVSTRARAVVDEEDGHAPARTVSRAFPW